MSNHDFEIEIDEYGTIAIDGDLDTNDQPTAVIYAMTPYSGEGVIDLPGIEIRFTEKTTIEARALLVVDRGQAEKIAEALLHATRPVER